MGSDVSLWLILATHVQYHDTDADEAFLRATKKFKDTVLDAAVEGGFTKRDIFETMVVQKGPLERIKALAQEACDSAGDDRLRIVRAAMSATVEEVGV